MVSFSVVRAANAALVQSQPLVAVFTAGVSGIGEYTLRALAATHSSQGKGLRVYIVGRKPAVAEALISDCLKVCPNGQFKFIKAEDVSLLADVDRVCEEIAKEVDRVDILIMSQGQVSFAGRRETKEGLDMDMSLLYYSRMRFVVKLLPLLLASSLPAHVISVYAAGMEQKLFQDDLSLRSPDHYSFANTRSHVVHMKTLFMEGLAERHAGRLSLVHVFPGLVITDGYKTANVSSWVKAAYVLVSPIIRPFLQSHRECGERILFFATPRFAARQAPRAGKTTVEMADGTDGVSGSGAYAVNWNGESISVEKTYVNLRKEGFPAKVWSHTMKAFEDIEAGKAFTD